MYHGSPYRVPPFPHGAMGSTLPSAQQSVLSTDPRNWCERLAYPTLSAPDSSASLAYSRGLAAGLAQAAFATGFVAGAAAVGSTTSPVSPAKPADKDKQVNRSSSVQPQMFWVDPRAFKEVELREQLEKETHVAVKCYRTADMCMRLLRKKQHFTNPNVLRILLVSWSNAPALVSFLEEHSLAAKVIILCDTCGGKGCGRATTWAQEHTGVEVAYTWSQALSAIRQTLSDFQKA